MPDHITASVLYDYVTCPHKVWRDRNGPQDEKNLEPNPFVQLLWDRGIYHEKEVVAGLGDFVNISGGNIQDRIRRTKEAIEARAPLIYQGELEVDNLRGVPDLLELQSDGTYIPIDIKSGMGREGMDEESDELGKLKKHYALQLALYVDVLIRQGYAIKRQGIVLDKDGTRVLYDLDQPQGARNRVTWWELYQQTVPVVSQLASNQEQNLPAMTGACKLCPWYKSCKTWANINDDPTTIFYVGRAVRDVLAQDLFITKGEELLNLDIPGEIAKKKSDKTYLKGIGELTLEKAVRRSKINHITKQPVIYDRIDLPDVPTEIFFDIEDDPTQELVYLHGVYVRQVGSPEEYKSFVAKTPDDEGERQAWLKFWEYIRSLRPGSFSVYYYSHHEKTIYKRLQQKYPDVITEDELKAFFDPVQAIDLYKVVSQKSDWPLPSYSIKELATFCGFSWRDKTPSGALSIQWYNEYLKTQDQTKLQRILDYNEDDCKATMVLKDKLQELKSNR